MSRLLIDEMLISVNRYNASEESPRTGALRAKFALRGALFHGMFTFDIWSTYAL